MGFITSSRYFLGLKPTPIAPWDRAVHPTSFFNAVQVMCMQLLFNYVNVQAFKYVLYPLEDSIAIVYQQSGMNPLFIGQGNTEVNLPWLLHCMNFFRCHMVRKELLTLHSAIERDRKSTRLNSSHWE